MNRLIVLLRGINVSGRNKLPMKELRALLTSSDFQNVQTYIQSGNIILDSCHSVKNTETQVTQSIKQAYGYEVPSFAYSIQDWENILEKCPYQEGERKIHMTFLDQVPKINQIKVSQVETDQFIITGHTVCLHYLSYGKTKLNNHFFENKLKVIATTRNFRTVNKLYALAK